jgi:hypothetical protein
MLAALVSCTSPIMRRWPVRGRHQAKQGEELAVVIKVVAAQSFEPMT